MTPEEYATQVMLVVEDQMEDYYGIGNPNSIGEVIIAAAAGQFRAAIAEERERCARIAIEIGQAVAHDGSIEYRIAQAIRDR